MRIRRTGAAVVAALLCAGLAACGGSDRPAAADSSNRAAMVAPSGSPSALPSHAPKPLASGPYVALGDSYTAGPGIPVRTGVPLGCDRSSHAYPALLAARLHLATAQFHDVSCSGARIADLGGEQSTSEGVNPAQLSALSSSTRLVTLGIGGNDIGFANLVERCVTAGLLRQTPCRDQLTAGGDSVEARIRTAGEQLAVALAAIHRRAPHARVYVVGYPAILPADGGACASGLAMTPGDVAYLRVKEQHLNTMLRQRAQAGGARFVDTWTPSLGHDACETAATRWIEPLLPAAQAASLHPNARGEQGMAEAVMATLGDES
ncbi:SGNH/GDSL hydrolase family protein [Streptacidiphilus melanogenes]|uniref:SGNH/GDSL hydrolase family protein n=1 Tax=Streptacidiphilus melanogenes TaxID=411235 RepID=UPI001F158F68|nr:SGNH/GDSL hydrolase family protein [Streptacidiphilus melanogenes]